MVLPFNPYILYIMDYIDAFRPRFSPVVDSIPYSFSVAAYRGRKRVPIAWFRYESDAIDYLARCRRDRPYIKFDYLQSIF